MRVHPAMVPAAPSAGQRARELQRGVRRGRGRRLADVLRPWRRRLPDGQRRARRRHRRRRQPAQGHPRLARLVRPGDASARSTRPRPSTSSTSRSPTSPACCTPSPACSPATTSASAPPSRRASAPTPGSCSSPTRPARPTCRRRVRELRELDVVRQRRRPAARDRRLRLDAVRLDPRRARPSLGFADVLLAGLATDGGLYVPADVAGAAAGARRGATYAERRRRRSWRRSSTATSARDDARRACAATRTRRSATRRSCPLVQLGDRHCRARAVPRPDAGVQGRRPAARRPAVRPRARRARSSGSRSSAPRAATPARRRSTACTDCANVDIVILYPDGRVSEVQRRQMTTVDAPNVHNVAVEGTFDDCQDLVKAMFADAPFRERMRLSAVNSINWARVMAQIVYYVVGRRSARAAPLHVLRARPATSATSSPAGSPGGWARRSTASSSARTPTTSSPASSTTTT